MRRQKQKDLRAAWLMATGTIQGGVPTHIMRRVRKNYIRNRQGLRGDPIVPPNTEAKHVVLMMGAMAAACITGGRFAKWVRHTYPIMKKQAAALRDQPPLFTSPTVFKVGG